ncbi:MAG: hypothetical protein ACLR4W_12140 [Oscillospiraceae bacterium]
MGVSLLIPLSGLVVAALPNYNNNNNFCNVNTGGGNNNNNAYYSAALLPGFYRYTVKWSNRKVKDDRCKRRDTSQGETPETAL